MVTFGKMRFDVIFDLVQVAFDAKQYAKAIGKQDRRNNAQELMYGRIFLANARHIHYPCVVIDTNQRVIAWLLPELLLVDVQVQNVLIR